MNNIIDWLNLSYNNVLPKKGKVLVSQPFLLDGCFKRSVVLLTEYSEEGTIGFVLNKPLNITIGDMMEDFPSPESALSIGGSVKTDTLHYLHTMEHIPDAIEIMNGIYWGGNIEVIKKLLSLSIMKREDIRFFLGYSGWSGGQLEDELENNSWLVGNINSKYIINPSQEMWKDSVINMGSQYKVWTTLPENPAFN
ncbi:MAG: YqgE/AlgH family protein [Bacteroidales bacterium]|jgi:putative transcriptional regulator|nr:YqgE/AlgH family protein [Bacteroidales bacterium]